MRSNISVAQKELLAWQSSQKLRQEPGKEETEAFTLWTEPQKAFKSSFTETGSY